MLTTKGTKRHESESRKKNRKSEYYCDVCSNTLTSMSSLHGEVVLIFSCFFVCFVVKNVFDCFISHKIYEYLPKGY